MNNANTNTTEKPVIINHTMYVVADSMKSGSITIKQLVGPMGGHFQLFCYSNGTVELCSMKLRRIWKGRL